MFINSESVIRNFYSVLKCCIISNYSSVLPPSSRTFESWLTLVECSKSIDFHEGCQLNEKRVWSKTPIGHFLYQKSSFVHRINCSVWGQEGIFSFFLETDLKHAAIVERSAPITVKTNREYRLESYVSTVFPCRQKDILPLALRRPSCAGPLDKVRAYSQGN